MVGIFLLDIGFQAQFAMPIVHLATQRLLDINKYRIRFIMQSRSMIDSNTSSVRAWRIT